MKIATIVGARPHFVKAAPVTRALEARGHTQILIHTGQHYDYAMSRVFFEMLGLPEPDHNLAVGSGSHGHQTGQLLALLEDLLQAISPEVVMVYGDTNSTLAGVLAAAKLDIPVAHVEAGERVWRRRETPEELNRVLTDHCAWLNLTCSERARRYLLREGMAPGRVKVVGDPMYDVFKLVTTQGLHDDSSRVSLEALGVAPGGYHLATLHRVENTSDPEHLLSILGVLDRADKPVLLPAHPRLESLLADLGYSPKGSLRILDALGYFDFIHLLVACDKCITDSGGACKEAFYAAKACIVPLPTSAWTDIVDNGWAIETGRSPAKLAAAIASFQPPAGPPPNLFGNGDTGQRIVHELEVALGQHPNEGPWHPRGLVSSLPGRQDTGQPFTLSSFAALVGEFQDASYRFASFLEAQDLLAAGERFVLWRHDIDLCLDAAVRMAELESRLGIRSTFFFLLRTEHYNLLSPRGTRALETILQLGHWLGLHFDCAAYPEDWSSAQLRAACGDEVRLLESWTRSPVSIVSYHRPDDRVLSGDPEIAPLPHTYLDRFRKEIAYVSDSMGRWRFGLPTCNPAFEERRPMQVLIHPIWWGPTSQAPYDTLDAYVGEQLARLEESIERNCVPYRLSPESGQPATSPLARTIHGERSEAKQIGPDARRTSPEGRSVLE